LYHLRLREIVEKKKMMENSTINGYIKKITEGSIENRIRRK